MIHITEDFLSETIESKKWHEILKLLKEKTVNPEFYI